ncbi:hypothetical protein [Paenibacillus sp. sgz500958]|uniref:hypothetical protein n=1 Tax=Paenibacillus sp. sgz500958 TaxID=3242475 RepID=UPI0036D24E08
MECEVNELIKTHSVIVNSLHHYVTYEVLAGLLERNECSNVFWNYTAKAHIIQSIIHWCMAFCNNKQLKDRWMSLEPFNDLELDSIFKIQLLTTTNFQSEVEWRAFYEEIVKYRDDFVTHRSMVSGITAIPLAAAAYEFVIFYDRFVREYINPDFLRGNTFKVTAQEYEKDVVNQLNSLCK